MSESIAYELILLGTTQLTRCKVPKVSEAEKELRKECKTCLQSVLSMSVKAFKSNLGIKKQEKENFNSTKNLSKEQIKKIQDIVQNKKVSKNDYKALFENDKILREQFQDYLKTQAFKNHIKNKISTQKQVLYQKISDLIIHNMDTNNGHYTMENYNKIIDEVKCLILNKQKKFYNQENESKILHQIHNFNRYNENDLSQFICSDSNKIKDQSSEIIHDLDNYYQSQDGTFEQQSICFYGNQTKDLSQEILHDFDNEALNYYDNFESQQQSIIA